MEVAPLKKSHIKGIHASDLFWDKHRDRVRPSVSTVMVLLQVVSLVTVMLGMSMRCSAVCDCFFAGGGGIFWLCSLGPFPWSLKL